MIGEKDYEVKVLKLVMEDMKEKNKMLTAKVKELTEELEKLKLLDKKDQV